MLHKFTQSSFRVSASITAFFDSFMKLFFATHFSAFRGSGKLLEPPLSQIIMAHGVPCMLESHPDICLLSRFFYASLSTPRASDGWCCLVLFSFICRDSIRSHCLAQSWILFKKQCHLGTTSLTQLRRACLGTAGWFRFQRQA